MATFLPAPRSAPGPARRVASDAVRQLIIYGGAYTIVAAVIVACLGASNGLAGRALGAVVAVVGGLLIWSYARRLPTGRLRELMATDRPLALAVYATIAGPALILIYALVGTPWPLALAVLAGATAEFAAFTRAR